MNLGSTLEEKKENYDLLDKKAKKWAKVGRIIGAICGVGIGLIMLSAQAEGIIGFIFSLLFAAALVVIMPIFWYHYAQILCYGFIVVKSWFVERGIGASEVAGAAGTSIAISYMLGGRKSAKIAGVTWLIMLGVVVSVGIFVGLYNYIKVQREMKALGIA
ncbi:MAG: hypothetical protein IJX92_05740 [Clostridia bacterium]|nr:hypothetical protein [Clostridia bacterium]